METLPHQPNWEQRMKRQDKLIKTSLIPHHTQTPQPYPPSQLIYKLNKPPENSWMAYLIVFTLFSYLALKSPPTRAVCCDQ